MEWFFGLLITLVQVDGEPFVTIIINMKQEELFVDLLDLWTFKERKVFKIFSSFSL